MNTTVTNFFAANQSLHELYKESEGVLFRFSTLFPFDLFPDEIIIDENKVSISGKDFFFTYHIHSIFIEDITDISVDTGLFFATLNITQSSNVRFPNCIKIRYVSKNTALTARKIIQGLIATKRRSIHLGELPINEVKDQVSSVGEMKGRSFRGA